MTCVQCGAAVHHTTICRTCVRALQTTARRIGGHYRDLVTVEGGQARYGSGRGGRRAGGPRSIDLAAANLAWDTRATLVSWCRTVMDAWPEYHPGPVCETCTHQTCTTAMRRAWPRDTVPSMCAYLIRMAGTIAAEDWAGVLLDELIDAEKRLYRAVDRPAERWYAGRCGHVEEAVQHDGTVCGCACHHGAGILCDVPGGCGLEFAPEPAAVCTAELWADDRPVVRCDTCGSTYEVQARRDSLLAEARDRTASVRVLARVVTTLGGRDLGEARLDARIRTWAARGRLTAVGARVIDGHSRPVYRIGDVLDLLDSDRPATGAQ